MKYTLTIADAEPGKFRVTVAEGDSKTTHVVAVPPQDLAKYAPGVTPEALLRAAFEFLLQREPKESILREFAIPDIERYFPDFRTKLRISG